MFLLQTEILTWITEFENPEQIPKIVLFTVALVQTAVIIKLLLPIIKKRPFFLKFTKSEKTASEKKPTKNILEKIIKKLDVIEDNIEKANKAYQELSNTVDNNTKIIKSTAKKTYENSVYNERLSSLKRLRNFKWYIGLRGNGNCVAYAKKIIIENKQIWLDILDEKDDFEIIDRKYYEETLAEIKKIIWDI